MTVATLRPALTTEAAVAKYWGLRRLLRAGAIDLLAAETTVRVIESHPHKRLGDLARDAYADELGRRFADDPREGEFAR